MSSVFGIYLSWNFKHFLKTMVGVKLSDYVSSCQELPRRPFASASSSLLQQASY